MCVWFFFLFVLFLKLVLAILRRYGPLLRALVHLIHDDVGDALKVHVALQSSQQHSGGAVKQPGGGRLKAQSVRELKKTQVSLEIFAR